MLVQCYNKLVTSLLFELLLPSKGSARSGCYLVIFSVVKGCKYVFSMLYISIKHFVTWPNRYLYCMCLAQTRLESPELNIWETEITYSWSESREIPVWSHWNHSARSSPSPSVTRIIEVCVRTPIKTWLFARPSSNHRQGHVKERLRKTLYKVLCRSVLLRYA